MSPRWLCERGYCGTARRCGTTTDVEWLKWLTEQGAPLLAACPADHGCDKWHPPGKPGKVPADTHGRHLGEWMRAEGQSPAELLRAHEAGAANIGLITGRRLRDGRYLVDLDVDGETGQRVAADLLRGTSGLSLAPAYRSGGGWHVLFAARERLRTTRDDGGHAGIALSADPGFTVLPPSRHASGGSYAWRPTREPRLLDLPPSLMHWARERTARRTETPRGNRIPAARMSTDEVLRQLRLHNVPAWLVSKLRSQPQGDRSAADFNAIVTLLAKRVPEPVICAIYRNPEFKIAEKYRERGDNYLALTIQKARASLQDFER